MSPVTSEPQGRGPAWPLGTVTVLGAHILDVLGRPVEEIPPGQGSVRLKEIRATAAGTAAGTGVDLAKLGARVRAVGALGDDLLGDIVIAAMARHGVDTAGVLVAVDVLHPGRPEDLDRLAPLLAVTDWFVPNADQLLALTGRRDLGPAIKDVIALGTTAVAVTCGADGCVVAGPGGRAPEALPALPVEVVDTTGCGDGFTAGLLAGLLLGSHQFGPDPFGPDSFGADPLDAAWLGLACGALVATGLGSDAGIENLGQVLSFLERTQPAAAGRIKDSTKEHIS
jgi:sugar/nucleoside kinase (ribokinase family)